MEGGEVVTSHETGCPRAWFKQSRIGSKIGYEVSDGEVFDGDVESNEEGKARDDRYVAAVT